MLGESLGHHSNYNANSSVVVDIIADTDLYSTSSDCKYSQQAIRSGGKLGDKDSDKRIEVYWINMKNSTDRRRNMGLHFDKIGFKHFRVEGVVMDEVLVPKDVERYLK